VAIIDIRPPPLSPELERALAQALRHAPAYTRFFPWFKQALRLPSLVGLASLLTELASTEHPQALRDHDRVLLDALVVTRASVSDDAVADLQAPPRNVTIQDLAQVSGAIELLPYGPWAGIPQLVQALEEIDLQVEHEHLPSTVREAWIEQVFQPQVQHFQEIAPEFEVTPSEDPGDQFGPGPVPGPGPGPDPDATPAAQPQPSPALSPTAAEISAGVSAGVSTAMMPALGALLAGLGGAMGKIGTSINQQHVTRQACVQSTGSTILRALAGVAGAVGLPLALLTTSQGRAVVDKAVGVAWDAIFNEEIVPKPASPDTALQAARTLFAEKAALGAAAHLLAMAAESSANIKHMGLGYFAAFLADMAGFERLAAATMGEVESAALGTPMRQKVLRDYRPTLPSPVDLETMYQKKEIAPGPIPEGFPPRSGFTEADELGTDINLYEAMSRYGMKDDWIRVSSHHLFKDPRMFELVRIGQFFNPELDERSKGHTEFTKKWIDARPWLLEQIQVTREEWDEQPWFYFKASVAGYEPADIRVIVETTLRAVVRREQTLMLDAGTRLFRDGFITREALRELTEEAWGLRVGPDGTFTFRGDPVAARVRATEVRTSYEVLSSLQELALRAFSRGLLLEEQVVARLSGLGMPPERIEEALVREQLGLVPRTRLAVAATVEPLVQQADEDDE